MDPLTGLNFGKVKKSITDVSAMSPKMMVIAFSFNPLKGRLVFWAVSGLTLHGVYFYLLIKVRSI